jgi:hypothetical protein
MLNYPRRACWISLGVSLALGLASVPVMQAIEPKELLLYSTGRFALKPQLTVSETFNDNIFYRNEGKVSDFITTLSPGLNFQVGSHDYNFIDLSYAFEHLFYVNESSQDANQHRLGLVNHFEHSRLTLNGQDQIQILDNPLGGGISVAGDKVRRTTFYDDYRLTYDLSEKTVPYVEILHSTVNYEQGEPLYDDLTLIGTLGFEYKAFSRASFFGELYYGSTSHDENADLDDYPTASYVGGFLGARGNFTEKLSGSLKAGYEIRSYRSSDAESSGLPVVELDLAEQFSELTTLTFAYSHRQLESVQFTKSAYTTDSVRLGLLQQIGNEGRCRANLTVSYLRADYEPNPVYVVKRTDNLISTGLALTYDFKLWLRGYLTYNFEHLDSTTPVVFSYDVNRVTVGVTLGY